MIHWTYIINLAVFVFVYGVVWQVNRKTKKLGKLKANLGGYYFYNGVLRLFMETFFDLLLASFLNVYVADWESPFPAVRYSNWLSVAVLAMLGLVLLVVVILYIRNYDILPLPEVREKYGAFMEGTDWYKLTE